MRASVGSPLGAARCRVRPLQGLQPESSSSVGAAGASWLRACGGARMPRHAAGDADARMVHARRSCGAHAAHSRAAAGWLLAACLRLRSHLVRADAAREPPSGHCVPAGGHEQTFPLQSLGPTGGGADAFPPRGERRGWRGCGMLALAVALDVPAIAVLVDFRTADAITRIHPMGERTDAQQPSSDTSRFGASIA